MYVQIVAFATWLAKYQQKLLLIHCIPFTFMTFITLLPSRIQHCAKQYPICISVFKCTQHKLICSSAKLSHRQIHSQNLGQLPFLTISKSHWIEFKNIFYIFPFLVLSPTFTGSVIPERNATTVYFPLKSTIFEYVKDLTSSQVW